MNILCETTTKYVLYIIISDNGSVRNERIFIESPLQLIETVIYVFGNYFPLCYTSEATVSFSFTLGEV